MAIPLNQLALLAALLGNKPLPWQAVAAAAAASAAAAAAVLEKAARLASFCAPLWVYTAASARSHLARLCCSSSGGLLPLRRVALPQPEPGFLLAFAY